jgi:hypothetical protein
MQYGCGMHTEMVYNLNHDNHIILALPYPNFSKFGPLVSTEYEDAQALYIHPIWILDAVGGGLQPQP